MKKNTHDITQPPEQQSFKKKYLLRKLEAQEAEKDIKGFTDKERDEQRYIGEEDYSS